MSGYHLAEINIARFREPIDDPVNADFVAALESVNAHADASDGFVWRLAGDGGDATGIHAYDDPNIAINMSVWSDLDSLAAFTYRNPEHLAIMRRRKEWFDRMELAFVLWWVPAGHIPTVEEGKARLELLRHKGPHADAFTFRAPFPAPDSDGIEPVLDSCA
ncbi:DUF3291 domain-containing protein [Asticcacaulis solisilvae]|uniref:DUF3291 domain-containing protein n=1 Tax=Asticcacaulis solisilvae TaxID=1217274 RepID=UPI003FD86DAD